MTAVEVLGSVDELADGTAGSVDAATGAAIGPYRKSRLIARDRTRPMRRENGLRHNFPDRVTERTDGTGGFVAAVHWGGNRSISQIPAKIRTKEE